VLAFSHRTCTPPAHAADELRQTLRVAVYLVERPEGSIEGLVSQEPRPERPVNRFEGRGPLESCLTRSVPFGYRLRRGGAAPEVGHYPEAESEQAGVARDGFSLSRRYPGQDRADEPRSLKGGPDP
jgi:hypothetical protein